MLVTEEILWHVWSYRLFDPFSLKTISGEPIEVLKPGEHNHNAGPDFFNARIKIGETTWAGNIEIHVKSSDWKKHGHDNDPAYSNIILHVVYENDLKDNPPIPVVELKNKISKSFINNYYRFISEKVWIPCEKQISGIKDITVQTWLHRMLVERLERKTTQVEDDLIKNKLNWEETFYHYLSRNFGFKVNSDAFELLARQTPLLYIAKHKNELLQVEAFLFGQAGLLEKGWDDHYYVSLQQEYSLLKNKFDLKPIDAHLWKFLRLRPVNFPTVRISQLAALIHQSTHLFSKILETKNYKEIQKLFDIKASDYWNNHFTFGKESKASEKVLGKNSIDNIIINTIVPFLFLYGKLKENETYKDRAFKILEETEAENNTIIKKWTSIGISSASAYETQALLELRNNYCIQKKCLHCSIGTTLLNKNV